MNDTTRRDSDRRLDKLEDKVDSIRDNVTQVLTKVTTFRDDLDKHEDVDRDRMQTIFKELNQQSNEVTKLGVVSVNNTKILEQIATKLGAVDSDRHAVKSIPKILAWILGILTGIAGIWGYLTGWIKPI